MGTSFGQFSLRARLGYAAHRLLASDLTVEAIAQRAGFVDASHFHRTFVRHYGCTPRTYRERAR
jgi:AraC-like DNA-binding protein